MKLISITTVKVPIYLKGHESRESIRILGVTFRTHNEHLDFFTLFLGSSITMLDEPQKDSINKA
ncbi:MAG: hypothetical protein BWZ03_00856 [bacterium ADurb.BinA186]|nr:MAG: hypothetical protein BWZ03_00856 [bacterium ADurb.BinA186]